MRLRNFNRLCKILSGEVNIWRSEEAQVLSESSLKGVSDGYFICQKMDFKKVENRVPTLSKQIMHALLIFTNFGSVRKKA